MTATFVASATFAASSAPQYFSMMTNAGGFIPRVVDAFDQFQAYQVKRASMMIYSNTAITTNLCLAYESAIDTTSGPSGATFALATQLGCNVVHGIGKTVNTVMSVPQNLISLRTNNWLPTVTVTNEANIQGYVVIVPSASTTGTVLVRFNVELIFKGPTAAVGTLSPGQLISKYERDIVNLRSRQESDGTVRFHSSELMSKMLTSASISKGVGLNNSPSSSGVLAEQKG